MKILLLASILLAVAAFICGQELFCFSYENGDSYPFQSYFQADKNTTVFVYDSVDDEAEFYTVGHYNEQNQAMVMTRMNYWRDLLWYADIFAFQAQKNPQEKGYKKFNYGAGMRMACIPDEIDFLVKGTPQSYIQCDDDPSPNTSRLINHSDKKNSKFMRVFQNKLFRQDTQNFRGMQAGKIMKAGNDTYDRCFDMYPSDPKVEKTRVQYKVYSADIKNKQTVYVGTAQTQGNEYLVYGVEMPINPILNMTFFHAYQPLPDQPTQKRGNKFVDYQANLIQYYNVGARIKSALSYSVGVLLTPDKMNTDATPKIVPCK